MLAGIELIDFRNYQRKKFEFEDGVNVIFGSNAAGKTNLLEGIYVLSTGESPRAGRTEEMIRFGQELGRIKGEVKTGEEVEELEVVLSNGFVGGVRSLKKKYLINGVSKRKRDFRGMVAVASFRPEDMDMLTGSPDHRRNFMDSILCQGDESYDRSLTTYTQGLRRRNKILDAIKEGLANRYSLTFWDGMLIKHGQIIEDHRRKFVTYINDLWSRSELFNKLKIEYDLSQISEERLASYKDEEVAAGYTLVGPHKDDLVVRDQQRLDPPTPKATEGPGRDLGIYGSRGEQRMAVLALKIGEIYFLESRRDDKPLLLLDDIFSELDEVHKVEVLRVMQNRQVIVTTALERDVELVGDCNKIFLGV